MKIIVDKIDEYPRHALSKADIRLIFSTVPPVWVERIKVVRLSSSRSAASVALIAAPVETLTVASRGRSRPDALRCVLVELAAHALGFKQRTFQHLQSRHQSKVECLVAPLMDELLPQLSHKTQSMDRDNTAQPALFPDHSRAVP
ncbi:MAG TPA: hypothetical protein VLD18_06445 [Verrucomicrobiae bacterium]|nr:hypothetical protein [Verrucomicrobiae bacterium]